MIQTQSSLTLIVLIIQTIVSAVSARYIFKATKQGALESVLVHFLLSEQVIQKTYKVSLQFGGTVPQHDYLKKHFKSRNPVFNIPRRNEPVNTDPVSSDTPAISDGSIMVHFFVGKDTLVCDSDAIKSQKQFINTLYDNIKTRGAMDTIITMVKV